MSDMSPPPVAPSPVRPRRHVLRWLLVAAGIMAMPVLIFLGVRQVFRVAAPPPPATPSTRRLAVIGGALLQYARDHGGAYPDTLATLADAEGLPADTPACPPGSPGQPAGLPYVYLAAGQTDHTTSNGTAVAYEPVAFNAGAGTHLLYGDGSVAWVAAADLAEELKNAVPKL